MAEKLVSIELFNEDDGLIQKDIFDKNELLMLLLHLNAENGNVANTYYFEKNDIKYYLEIKPLKVQTKLSI